MQFPPALQSWFKTFRHISVRQITLATGLTNLSQFRSGNRRITFDALERLLPVIEAHSSRLHALTLHLAYLADETVTHYKDDIQITATDPLGQPQDVYDQLAADWVRRAKSDSNFWAMWAGLDSYMHHPDRLDILDRQLDDDSSHLALVAETPAMTATLPTLPSPMTPAGQSLAAASCSGPHDPVDGPRIPARWGTFPTLVCAHCQMWKIHPSIGPNDWQPKESLAQRQSAEDDDDL